MPRTIFCWRCRIEIPMLTADEWQIVSDCLNVGGVDRSAKHQQALDAYERITGFKETNINALFHHRLQDHGPDCGACGKPLRTSRASFCAACGALRRNVSWP